MQKLHDGAEGHVIALPDDREADGLEVGRSTCVSELILLASLSGMWSALKTVVVATGWSSILCSKMSETRLCYAFKYGG